MLRELSEIFHQTGHLAMETLLSLTSKRAGDWFKEELRLLGGLDHIIDKGVHARTVYYTVLLIYSGHCSVQCNGFYNSNVVSKLIMLQLNCYITTKINVVLKIHFLPVSVSVKECVENLDAGDDHENLVASLWGAERCLRVLESVSTNVLSYV